MRKAAGAGLIILAFAYAGLLLVRTKKERIALLKALSDALSGLHAELGIRLTPLPEALSFLAQSGEASGAAFFSEVSSESFGELSFRERWCLAADRELMCLTSDERNELKRLGTFLGTYELSEQLNAISLCRAKLEHSRRRAEDELSGYTRSCIGLCISFGILLAILLV